MEPQIDGNKFHTQNPTLPSQDVGEGEKTEPTEQSGTETATNKPKPKILGMNSCGFFAAIVVGGGILGVIVGVILILILKPIGHTDEWYKIWTPGRAQKLYITYVPVDPTSEYAFVNCAFVVSADDGKYYTQAPIHKIENINPYTSINGWEEIDPAKYQSHLFPCESLVERYPSISGEVVDWVALEHTSAPEWRIIEYYVLLDDGSIWQTMEYRSSVVIFVWIILLTLAGLAGVILSAIIGLIIIVARQLKTE